MPLQFERAQVEIKNYVERLIPTASVGWVGKNLGVRVGTKHEVLTFGEDRLDDLEQALTNPSLPARYVNGQVRDATFGTLVALGKRGMAPDVSLSSLIAREDLDWTPAVRLQTSFDDVTAKKLYEELTVLLAFAQELLSQGVAVPEIQHEREVMESIITFYNENGHLRSAGVTRESLSYLKAAAFCWLLELEARPLTLGSHRLRSAESIRRYALVEEFWILRPYDRVALPPIIEDFLTYREANHRRAANSVGPSLDVGPALKALDPRLEERWRGAWQALQSDNPDKVSQAANSMVEALDKVIARICGSREFKDVLAERFPSLERVVEAQRELITAIKQKLNSVKHETNAQNEHLAQDLVHATEGIIRTLLR